MRGTLMPDALTFASRNPIPESPAMARSPLPAPSAYSTPFVLGTSSPDTATACRNARPSALKMASATW